MDKIAPLFFSLTLTDTWGPLVSLPHRLPPSISSPSRATVAQYPPSSSPSLTWRRPCRLQHALGSTRSLWSPGSGGMTCLPMCAPSGSVEAARWLACPRAHIAAVQQRRGGLRVRLPGSSAMSCSLTRSPGDNATARTRMLAGHGARLEVARLGDGALASQTGAGGLRPAVRRAGPAVALHRPASGMRWRWGSSRVALSKGAWHRCRGRRWLSCSKGAVEAGGTLAGGDALARGAEGTARNEEESVWERDDKWARYVIEWDRGRLAGAQVSIRKYVRFSMPESGPNMPFGVRNGVFQSKKQLQWH
jgi:hypothetical protein